MSLLVLSTYFWGEIAKMFYFSFGDLKEEGFEEGLRF